MWYDIVVLVLLIWFAARGASRGLIWQLAGIAGIILCLFFSESFAAIVGPHVSLDPPLNEWVVLFAAYLFFTFIAFGVARVINRGIEQADMKEFNRHLGAVLGLIKGSVLCLVMTFFVATLPSMHEAIRESKSGRVAAIVMNKIHPVMPPKLHDALEKYIHSLYDVETGLPPVDEHSHLDDPFGQAISDAAQPATDNPWLSTLGLDSPAQSQSSPPPVSNIPQSSVPGTAAVTPQYRSSIPVGAQRPTTASPTAPAAPSTSDQLLTEIQGALGSEVRRQLTETLGNLDPQTRQQLQSQIVDVLKQASPQDLPRIGQYLQQAGSSQMPQMLDSLSNSLANQPATAASDESQRLLEEISQLRSTFPQVQSRLQAEVRGLMKGVPDAVQVAILRDWKSDLSPSNQASDPDPSTNSSTPIEMRVLKQIEKAGMRIDRLDPDLQDRLSAGSEGGVQLR